MQPIKQYDFSLGPNYTDSVYQLSNEEVAESDNMYYDGSLKTIPGASPLTAGVVPDATAIIGLMRYNLPSGTSRLVAANASGRIVFSTLGVTWGALTTGLSTSATTCWTSTTFNNTLILASGSNVVKKWDTTTFGNLGGSPPQSRYVESVNDFVFLAGHTASPSQLRFSDVALHNVWPANNAIYIGRDDGSIITALKKWGEQLVVFKEENIWILDGLTPTTFAPRPTGSSIGCIAPHSPTLTEYGIFFWSQGGPALFNGSTTILLNRRLRRLLATVDWTQAGLLKIFTAYYPQFKKLLFSYQRSGQSIPDRALLLDLYNFNPEKPVFWPITFGGTSLATFPKDGIDIPQIMIGRNDGKVLNFDAASATQWDTSNIVPRVRTRYYNLGDFSRVIGIRTTDVWTDASSGQVVAKYALDGATAFTTHPLTPLSLTNSGKDVKFHRIDGDGVGNLLVGRMAQWEFTTNNNVTGLTLHGIEVGLEDLGRRND